MQDYLILKLDGPMQAWGRESFEGFRPSELFPGKSALLGLLGACFGCDRHDIEGQKTLAESFAFAVRIDEPGQKMTDYHTVKDARVDYQSLKSHETIQTWREYLQDAKYTVAVWLNKTSGLSLEECKNAIRSPIFTPVLGRRSCPLARPLYEAEVQANTSVDALSLVEPASGTIYTEENIESSIPIRMRDVPILHQPRQFASRFIYLVRENGGCHVP